MSSRAAFDVAGDRGFAAVKRDFRGLPVSGPGTAGGVTSNRFSTRSEVAGKIFSDVPCLLTRPNFPGIQPPVQRALGNLYEPPRKCL